MDEFNVDDIDSVMQAIYLELPESKVVLLQAIFEMYEGLGLVRTLDREKSFVCVLTSKDLLTDCKNLLGSIKGDLMWRHGPTPSAELKQRYFTCFK